MSFSGSFSIFSSHLSDSGLKGEENSTISMNFTLNENCNLHDELWVIVARVQKPQEESEPVIERDICTIRNLKDSCESWTSQICSCSKEKGVYTLRKTVEQSDNTTWVWRTDPEVAEVTELAFVVS
ncbi:hypothetical protein BaRGS_00018473, partial [Batillaria attramentaria]